MKKDIHKIIKGDSKTHAFTKRKIKAIGRNYLVEIQKNLTEYHIKKHSDYLLP